MIARSVGTTRTVEAPSDLLTWVTTVAGDGIDIVLDPAAPADGLVRALRGAAPGSVVHPQDPGTGAPELLSRLRPGAAVVAIGGGAVIDRTKLAVRLGAGDGVQVRLPHRSAMVLLPPLPRAHRPLAAVPTTLGTGSEVSKVAVDVEPDRRRLVVGDGMQPDIALHDPRLGAGLPETLVAEGLLEVLARLIGPYIGEPRPLPVQDAVAEALLRLLGPLLVSAGHDGLTAADRATVLRIGALSHQDAVVGGRSPYGVKWWALVNEICAVGHARKVPVLAAVLPVVLARILAGDRRWGNAARLRALWQVLGHASGGLVPADPVVGTRVLLEHLHVRVDPAVAQLPVEAVAHRLHRGWGAGLAMYAGFDERDLLEVVHDVVGEAARLPPAPTSMTTAGRRSEVPTAGEEVRRR